MVKIQITQRKLNGLYAFGSVVMIIVFWVMLDLHNKSMNQAFETVGLDFRIKMQTVNSIFSVAVTTGIKSGKAKEH